MNIRDSVYLVSMVFQTVLVYKFINVFLGSAIKGGVIKYSLYIGYYLVISYIYLFVRVHIAIISTNLIVLIALTLNHEGTVKKKALSVVYIYVASILSEAITVSSLRMLNIVREPFPFTDSEFIASRITSLIILYPFVLLYSSLSLSKNKEEVPSIFWFVAIFVPLTTLIPSFLILFIPQTNDFVMLLTVVMVLFLNILIFYFYGEVIKLYQSKMEKEIYQLQLKAYSNQFNLLENQTNNMKAFKHDIINHISALRIFIENDETASAAAYLEGMYQTILNKEEYVKTNNTAISSILNYKIGEAYKFNIDVKRDINIPDALDVSAVDLTAIIGNLFDNAIEALKQIENDREIKFSLTYENGLLHMIIENKFLGSILFNGDRILTNKHDKNEHGIGLLSIRNSLKRYDGIMDISTESNKFRVAIMLYNKKLL
ncbi:MAG: GHKL domain-containing protein [Defluviitaleaceae bacterium]|nr:GHKL domain-containing protein [Defluviitaleaceae bacterium]